MKAFNLKIAKHRDRTLFFFACIHTIGAFVGFLSFVTIKSSFSKSLLILFIFSMISHWAFYFLFNLVKSLNIKSKFMTTLFMYVIFTFISLSNPLDFQFMWVYLLYFPIVIGLIENEFTYKIWGVFYLISYVIYLVINSYKTGQFVHENTLLLIMQILLASGSLIVGYVIVKHLTYVKSLTRNDVDKQIKEHIFEVLSTLIPIVETKSQTTKNEINEMSALMKNIIRKLPDLHVKEWEVELLSLLHFVSRIQWPDYLFEKHEKLTEYEFNIVQNHCQFGYKLLGDTEAFKNVRDAFLKHHKRTDGSGYPNMIEGNHIPQLAQILGLVECFLAMINPRAYRSPMTIENALFEIQVLERTRVDSEILGALVTVVNENYAIKKNPVNYINVPDAV
jgi:hypothetical protein